MIGIKEVINISVAFTNNHHSNNSLRFVVQIPTKTNQFHKRDITSSYAILAVYNFLRATRTVGLTALNCLHYSNHRSVEW